MTQKREIELFVSLKDVRLDNRLDIIHNRHFGIEETDSFLVDKLADLQEILKALIDEIGKMKTDLW